MHAPAVSCLWRAGYWHLLRDGTGEDDNFDSALLTMSHAPEDFSRRVFMEEADKPDREWKLIITFQAPSYVMFANISSLKVNYIARPRNQAGQVTGRLDEDGPPCVLKIDLKLICLLIKTFFFF